MERLNIDFLGIGETRNMNMEDIESSVQIDREMKDEKDSHSG